MYDRYEFDQETEARLKEFERELAEYWSPKKENIPLPQRAVKENWDSRKIREACTRRNADGGSVFMLGQYEILLTEIDRVRRSQE